MERQRRLRGAAVVGDLPRVRRILQQPGGVNVNAGDEDGWTALHLAVFRGHLAIVQAILQAVGVNVNARTEMGWTPLHFSAYRLSDANRANRVPIIQALQEAGADPNAADDDGETPLFLYAIHRCPISSVEALLDAGANPAAQNNNLDTPLHRACLYGRLDVVQVFIQRQGSECLTVKNDREDTPLDQLGPNNGFPDAVKNSIRQHILQSYAGVLAQRDGLLCLHSVLQDAAFTDVADDGNNEEFELPMGKLNTEHLQKLLEYILAMEPGSVRALNSDGLLPLQVASQLNFPELVLNALLRPYPDALLLL